LILNKLIISGEKAREIETEIRFNVASERACGSDIMCFDFGTYDKEENSERAMRVAKRILRTMKLEHIIQAFASVGQLKTLDTDAAYLLNKYPDIEIPDQQNLIYVKL
jgi:hypothetical protein